MTAIQDVVAPAFTGGDDLRTKAAELRAAKDEAERGPSLRAAEQQHARGKLTVRERLGLLFDPGTFREIEQFRRHRATGVTTLVDALAMLRAKHTRPSRKHGNPPV